MEPLEPLTVGKFLGATTFLTGKTWELDERIKTMSMPLEVAVRILFYANSPTYSFSKECKRITELLSFSHVFSSDNWLNLLKKKNLSDQLAIDRTKEPVLPLGFQNFIASKNLINPFLVLIPAGITVEIFAKIAQFIPNEENGGYKEINPNCLSFKNQGNSYWVVMDRNPVGFYLDMARQEEHVNSLGCEIPQILEAAICSFIADQVFHQISSQKYPCYIRCAEKLGKGLGHATLILSEKNKYALRSFNAVWNACLGTFALKRLPAK